MQVLDALSHAHRAGVVHRDLKPANLMITEHGIVKVMDFGIARVLGTEHFTQGGYMMGTPAYMAPEQVLGGEIDGRADLYAVGVVLYRLLSGQLPFSADTAIAMVQKQVNDSPIPIAQFQPDLPAWCARVLTRALAKSPGDRFQTADEFRTALLAAVQPQTLGELPTMATPTPRLSWRRRAIRPDAAVARPRRFATTSAPARRRLPHRWRHRSPPQPPVAAPAPAGPRRTDRAGRAGEASVRQFDDRGARPESAGRVWRDGGGARCWRWSACGYLRDAPLRVPPADADRRGAGRRGQAGGRTPRLLPANPDAGGGAGQCRCTTGRGRERSGRHDGGPSGRPLPKPAGRAALPTDGSLAPGAAAAPGARGARGAVPPPAAARP